MDDRLPHISFLQSYGIILVVLGHSTYQLGHSGCTPWVNSWLYQFHMSLFFFISGYLLRYGCERRNCRLTEMKFRGRNGFLAGKIRRLLLPYVVLNTVAFLPKSIVSGMALRPVDFSLQGYVHMLLYPADNIIGFMWFLPALFIVFMLFMVITRIADEKYLPLIMCALVVVGVAVPFHRVELLCLGTACIYFVFFVFGYWFRDSRMERVIERHAAAIFTCTFAISVAMVAAPDFRLRFYLCAFNGVVMSIALARIYVDRRCHIIDHLNGASYTIYLLSWFPQVASQQMLMYLVPGIPWPVTTILAIVTGLYVPLAVYRWAGKHMSCRAVRFVAPVIGMTSKQSNNKE